MKKYILMMAAAIFGFSACQDELEELQLLDPSQIVAPVLHQLPEEIVITPDNMSEVLTFSWDKAYFGQPVQYNYSICASTDGGATLVKLYSNISTTSFEVVYEAFNQVVTTDAAKGGLGLTADQLQDVAFYVGATVGTNYTTYYSAPVTASVSPTQAERVYETVWLPGSANGWDHSKALKLYCYAEDHNTFIGAVDFGADYASNEFKVTGAADWSSATGNWGVADPTTPAESASIQLLNDSNDNITQYRAHRYYHFTFTKSDLVLKMDSGFDKVGIIGLNGDWDNDIEMTLSRKSKFYADIDVAAATEFKFRLNGGWDVNWGGDMAGLTNGGDNIPVAAGQYRVYFDLNDWGKPTAKLDASMYGQDEDAEEPQPPVTYQGWGIIGDFNEWGDDVHMAEVDGVWTGYFTNIENGGFKLRKDADWAENYGGTFVELGVPFAAGSDNIAAPAGFLKVVLDLSGETPMITVSEGTVWSLIGVGGDWNNDIDMVLTEGLWVSPATTISGEFKLRYNHGWDVNRGGTFASVGVAFEAVQGGDNINVPEGNYVVTYDPDKDLITVDGALPENCWSLIGVNNDWTNDIYMTHYASGIWVSPALAFSGEFKIRFNNGWDVNRGGTFSDAGVAFNVVGGGANISLPEGTWQVVYNPMLETITVNEAANSWSVIGEFEGFSWNNDLFLSRVPQGYSIGESGQQNRPRKMAADYTYRSETFRVDGGFKLRYNANWDVNLGGTFVTDGEYFSVEQGGANISVDAPGNYYNLVYESFENEHYVKINKAWCIIGNVEGTSWDKDFPMTETSDGIWMGSVVVNGGFKIRKSGNWDINRGGTYSEGLPFDVVNNGDNISVPENDKKYLVVYNAYSETMLVTLMSAE